MDFKMKKNMIVFIFLILSILSMGIVFGVDNLAEKDGHSYAINTFLDNNDDMLGLLVPAILLTITLITFAIDFGTVGVSAASLASLIILYYMNIIYINPVNLVSFIIIIGIMMYKMQG